MKHHSLRLFFVLLCTPLSSRHSEVKSFGVPSHGVVSIRRICRFHHGSTTFIHSHGPTSSTIVSSHAAAAREEDDNNNDDDHVEEDYELLTYDEYKERLQALSFLSSMDRTAAPRAEELVSQMLDRFCNNEKEEESVRPPTTELYNLVLNCWSYSRAKNGAERAEELLLRMESATPEHVAEGLGARPDTGSYAAVMDGHINRRDPERAEATFRRLQDRYEHEQAGGDDDNDPTVLRPTVSVYNRRVKAWRVVSGRRRDAVSRAEAVLDDMLALYDDDDMKPNAKTFAQLIATHAQSRRKNSGQQAQKVFDRMSALYRDTGDDTFKPCTLVFNALIKAYATSGDKDRGSRAESILRIMEATCPEDADVTPNETSYVHTIQAYADTPPGAVRRVEALLQALDGTEAVLIPTLHLYNAAVKTISRSNDAHKASSAHELLSRMASSDDATVPQPDLRTYNLVLRACAYTSSEEESSEACRIAIRTFNAISGSSGSSSTAPLMKPNHITYGLFLKVCGSLLPPHYDKRESVVENLFRKCCEDGMVTDFVLQELAQAASEELRTNLLGATLLEGTTEDVPLQWSRNVNT